MNFSVNNSGGEKRSMSSNQRLTQQPNNSNITNNNTLTKFSHNNSEIDVGSSTNSFMKQTQIQPYDNLRVVIRIRPPLAREIEEDLPFRSIGIVSNENKNCSLAEYLGSEYEERERQREWVENPNLFQLHRFTFDYVFDLDSTQDEVYNMTAKTPVLSMLEGYNSTIFAYGQTGTGKTYTMEGFTYNSNDPNRGIIPRSIDEIFNYIESLTSSGTKFMVRASYLQIYNESISDLLKNEKSTLQIREDKKKGVFVEGLSEWAVRSPTDIYNLLQKGASNRETSSTKMNDVSSRSHAVFITTVEQMVIVDDGKEGYTQIKVGKLNLVDLAGSERIRVTGATGKQLEESKKINKSLSALGNVIYALTDTQTKRTHVPYRDSKLTRLLEDSLGGNCKTTMMAMISPAYESFSESLSTLHFARRAKNIKNAPRINEDLDQKALIRQYEVELKKLRFELDEKNKIIQTNELVIQLEDEKKQAEQDKMMAIDALEQASKRYFQEREERQNLEAKIQMMKSQVIVGGHKIEETPQFKNALAEKHSLLIKEFDTKFQDFEKERQQLEQDKVQVEKYKSLLLKQRDIMIQLTAKLNERDEALVQFQEEVEAYDKISRETDEIMEIKNQRITLLENILKRNNLKIPTEVKTDKIERKKITEKVYIPYKMENNEEDNIINGTRNEFENLKSIEKQNNDLMEEKRTKIGNIKNDYLRLLDKVNNDNYNNLQQDMISIYNELVSLSQDDDIKNIFNNSHSNNNVNNNYDDYSITNNNINSINRNKQLNANNSNNTLNTNNVNFPNNLNKQLKPNTNSYNNINNHNSNNQIQNPSLLQVDKQKDTKNDYNNNLNNKLNNNINTINNINVNNSNNMVNTGYTNVNNSNNIANPNNSRSFSKDNDKRETFGPKIAKLDKENKEYNNINPNVNKIAVYGNQNELANTNSNSKDTNSNVDNMHNIDKKYIQSMNANKINNDYYNEGIQRNNEFVSNSNISNRANSSNNMSSNMHSNMSNNISNNMNNNLNNNFVNVNNNKITNKPLSNDKIQKPNININPQNNSERFGGGFRESNTKNLNSNINPNYINPNNQNNINNQPNYNPNNIPTNNMITNMNINSSINNLGSSLNNYHRSNTSNTQKINSQYGINNNNNYYNNYKEDKRNINNTNNTNNTNISNINYNNNSNLVSLENIGVIETKDSNNPKYNFKKIEEISNNNVNTSLISNNSKNSSFFNKFLNK